MRRFEARLLRLEAQRRPIVPAPTEMPPLDEILARIHVTIREQESEEACRALLPIEEQTRLLEGDRGNLRADCARRASNGAVAVDALQAVRARIIEQAIERLRRQQEVARPS